jgi:thiol-disulfide isomerase/thioredoxin
MAGATVQAQGYDAQPWRAHQPTPAFSGTDLTGKVWQLADLRGKAVLLNFWASWCEPCRAEMPALQALAQRYGPDKLQVLTVNFKESVPKMAQFVTATDLTLPVLADPAGAMARRWGVSVFPTTVLIAADGRVHQSIRGEVDWTGRSAEVWLQPLFKR